MIFTSAIAAVAVLPGFWIEGIQDDKQRHFGAESIATGVGCD